jgi:hypothetical protein
MPILVSLLAVDIGGMLDDKSNFTYGNIVGFLIRYAILFLIGGFIAYLHEDEQTPFKLFEIGIAAPALISSLITAQAVNIPSQASIEQQTQNSIISLFISSANATEFIQEDPDQVIYLADFYSDVYKGLTGKVYSEQAKRRVTRPKQANGSQKGSETKIRAGSKPTSKTQTTQSKTRGIDSTNAYIGLSSNQDRSLESLRQALVDARAEVESAKVKVKKLEKRYHLKLQQ